MISPILDPNEPISVRITNNGFIEVRSPRLEAKGRGAEEISIKVLDGDGEPVLETTGSASNTSFSGLKVNKDYEFVVVTNRRGKKIEYTDKVFSSKRAHYLNTFIRTSRWLFKDFSFNDPVWEKQFLKLSQVV